MTKILDSLHSGLFDINILNSSLKDTTARKRNVEEKTDMAEDVVEGGIKKAFGYVGKSSKCESDALQTRFCWSASKSGEICVGRRNHDVPA